MTVAPGLGARMDDVGVADAAGRDRTLDERALAAVALDQRDLRAGERDREREAREPGAGAEVGDRRRPPGPAELERDERIGEVVVERPLGSRTVVGASGSVATSSSSAASCAAAPSGSP